MVQEGCEDAPVIFVQASELPKGALVEFQVNFHTGRPTVPDLVHTDNHRQEKHEDNDEDDVEDLDAVYSSGEGSGMKWEISTADRAGHGSRAIVFIDGTSSPSIPNYS